MTPSITEDDVLTAVRAFLLSILPTGVEVIAGQVNRVAEPASLDFVVMTPMMRMRLAMNLTDYDPVASTATLSHSTQLGLQLDVHGPNSTDNCQVIGTFLRSGFGVDALAAFGVAPLYIDDGHQMPFVNGENQYEDRWVITAQLQVNPAIVTPQGFAATVSPTVVDICAT